MRVCVCVCVAEFCEFTIINKNSPDSRWPYCLPMLFRRRRSLSGTWGCSWISMCKNQTIQVFVQTNCKNSDKITELHKNVSLFTSQMEKYLRLWLKDTDIDVSRMLTNAYHDTPLMPSNIPWAVEAKKTVKTVALSEHVSRRRDACQTGRLACCAKWAVVAAVNCSNGYFPVGSV